MPDKKAASTHPQEQDHFMMHLDNASKIVHSWPAWKQTVLGGTVDIAEPNATGSAQTSREEQMPPGE